MDAVQKAKLGSRWACFSCGAKFYDLNRPGGPICPRCGTDQREFVASSTAKKARPKTPKKATPKKVTKKKRRPKETSPEEEVERVDTDDSKTLIESGDVDDLPEHELDLNDLSVSVVEDVAETDQD